MKDNFHDKAIWALLLVMVFITAWLAVDYYRINEQNKQWDALYWQSEDIYLQGMKAQTLYWQKELARTYSMQDDISAACDTMIIIARSDSTFPIEPDSMITTIPRQTHAYMRWIGK